MADGSRCRGNRVPVWAGRAHAAAYRTASALYSPILPPVRLISIGDVNAEFGTAGLRAGIRVMSGTTPSWQAISEADDIDVVSVVIANSLHRECSRRPAGCRQARAVRKAAQRHLG